MEGIFFKTAPHTYVLEPSSETAKRGRKAVLRVEAKAPGNKKIADQLLRWLRWQDHLEGNSITIALPDAEGGGTGTLTIVPMQDPSNPKRVTVRLSVAHGRDHYDHFDYDLYPVNVRGEREMLRTSTERFPRDLDEGPLRRLSDFGEEELERGSLNIVPFHRLREEPRRHILDDPDEEEEEEFMDEAHEKFDAAFAELQDKLNDPFMSIPQRDAKERTIQRFVIVHDRLMQQLAEQDARYERQWTRAMRHMMEEEEAEENSIFAQAERFLRQRGHRESPVLQGMLEQQEEERRRVRERHAYQRKREREELEREHHLKKHREIDSPGGGSIEDVDAAMIIGGQIAPGFTVQNTGVGKAHMLAIGTLLLDCVTIAGDTGDADMIAKLGHLTQICGHCAHVGCHHRCKRCKKVAYCDTDCQHAHWEEHKKECMPN